MTAERFTRLYVALLLLSCVVGGMLARLSATQS